MIVPYRYREAVLKAYMNSNAVKGKKFCAWILGQQITCNSKAGENIQINHLSQTLNPISFH